MLKKFFKHKHSSRLLAWLLVGVMALSSAGVMPVVAADVSGGDAAVVSGGDVSGGNGATKNYLTLDGAEVTYDLRQSTFGAYSKTENTWTAADGICSVSGTISFNDAQHGASVTNGTTFAVNAPAGKVTITLGGCAYGSSSATLYVNGNAVGDAVSIGGLAADETDVTLSTVLAEAGEVSVVISGNGYLHYVKAQAETVKEVKYLTLDGDEVTYDLRESAFGAYSKTGTTWTAADGIGSVSGTISFNDAQHGASVTNGTTFAVNAPAGNVTITLGGCAYGSSSATLYVNGNAVGEAVSIGGLAADETDVELSTVLTEAGVVSVVISGNGYLHYVKAKATTPTEDGEDEGNQSSTNVRVFDAGDLEDIAKGSKTAGDEVACGDFTLICHGNTAVEGKAVTFEDNYTSTKRLSLGGSLKTNAAGVKFTTTGAATVKVYWICGGVSDPAREMKIIDEAGTQVAITSVVPEKDSQYISTLEIPVAGTYIIGSANSSNYVFRIEVAEEVVEVQPTVTERVFDAGDLEDIAKGSKTAGDEVACGDFTLICHGNTAVEGKAVTFEDNYTSTKRLSLGGSLKTNAAGVKFTTTGAATVKVYWICGGVSDPAREMKLIDEAGTQVAITSVVPEKDSQYISTLEIPAAGTYIIGSANSSNYVFRIVVTEESAGAPTEKLAEMTLEDLPETWNFRGTSTIFGSAAADIEGDSVFSANKFIKITKDAADAWDVTTSGHGLTFVKDVVIEVLVPANTMGVFTFIGCDYASCNAVMTAGGETGESISLDNGQDAQIPFKYENETNATVTMKITVSTGSRGYFHGVSYEVQEIPAKSWESGKTGVVTIGDTTFEVKSGAEGAAYTVTATSGTGRVEIAGAEKAVVWTDLDGAKLANAVTAGEGVSEVAVSGKVVTITYEDDTTLPEAYSLEVRELGKTKEPKQDGTTTTYNLLDGSIISDLYKNSKVPNGASITSEDGNFTITSNGNLGYHGTTYGIVLNPGNSFAVKVAGNAKVTIVGSSFGTSAIEATADGDGVIYVQGDEESNIADTSSKEQLSSNFVYEGEETTLYFNFTGATYYVASVMVKNELPPIPEGETHPELGYILPSVINWDNGLLEATVMGQTVSLSNPTQAPLDKINIKTCGLGIYVFPLTGDNNTLSVDIVAGACGSSNNNAIYMGLFNESVANDDNGIRAITTGIRNSNNEVVQLMSKKDNEVLGKNSFNGAVMEAGDVVRITITRDGSNIIQTFTNLTQGTATVEKKTAYGSTKSFLNPDGDVYYGVMVSNKDAVIKNMVYTAADGTVLFDQNKYYDPVGDIPVVTEVTAVGAEDRTKITITWTADDALFDAKYVLQVMKPGTTEWVDVATELTDKSYAYPVSIGESGAYKFRVCGTRGNAAEQNLANRNTYAVSNVAEIEAALETPVLTLPYVSAADKVELSWTASAGAASYEVYRRYDDKEAEVVATVTENSFVDTTVTTNVPYYYSVKALSADNFSPVSEEKWTVPTSGFTGDFDENIALHLTKRSNNTVFENKITLEGIVGAAGTVKVYVNGTEKASQAVASANGTFSFTDVEISAGRNEVELVLEYGNNLKLRKSLNYVYLTNYNYVVDDDFTGTDGTADANGIPQYKTVAAAVAAAGASGSTTNVILVRNGDYNEKLVINVPNISLIGEDSEATRIHYAICDGNKGSETRYAVSILQGATNFTAENICLENSWAYLGDGTYSNESGEAVYVEKTDAVFVGVRMMGYQDTLQSKDGNIYVLRTYIAGNVDFMWGQRGTMTFEDCDIVFRYNARKNSGYYTAYGPETQAIYNNCRFYSEEECGGSKYYLGRPYNGSTAVAFINCYMGSIINKEWGYASWAGAELSTDPTQYNATEYFEFGSYGPSAAININRRQISEAVATNMLTTTGLGWDPYRLVTALGTKYIGNVVTEPNDETVESEYESNSYSPYESDDTGLGKYSMEGFAESAVVTGGGLLKETNENYYKVATGDEFLAALKAVKDKKGVPSVIEITADIAVGINEINANHASLYGTGVVQAHNPALVNPVLIESGVSKVYIKQMSNLTIFSQNGATVKHGAFNISDSDNIIIRNLSFDELWEWDEGNPNDASIKAGDYDVNDWDYMTIDNGSNGVWIDHCTFYKAYDGIIDIKTSDAYANPMNVTISWCEFMPGSKNNTFFNEMMDYVKENKANMPYYQYLLGKGMTDEQIWWYAYGQKKTHLLGQSDDATANVNLKVTLANNSYYNSMDRMPRLRYGTAHVYNCIMDAQEILDMKKTINAEIASKLVSNGAISTCNGQVLLENCYLNGIQWALISGNGSSPNGSIAAVDSLYYVDGVRYALVPVTKSTVGEEPKITDADAFVANLPYSDYVLYDAADLETVVKPYVGAGKLDMDVLQWEKGTYYDATFVAPEEGGNYDDDELPTYDIPEDVPAVTPTPGTSAGTAVVLPTTNDWTTVNTEITTDGAATTEGIAHVDTTSTGTIEVPVYVIENLKGKNVSLMLHNGQGVAISITGSMLGDTTAQAVNATVVSDANTIPADVVAEKTEALTTKQLSVKNEGAFAVPVNMHVNVGKDYAGDYATLYKYDQTTGELVCAGCFVVTENGQAMFAMFEGGEYLLAVTAEKPADLSIAALGRYVVKTGDSMYAIARMYKMTLQNLLLKNPQIADPNMIRVGDKINVR